MDRYDLNWEEKYLLAKNYYEYYGNLNVPTNFKTKDGINYNEKGINLGSWIINQRAMKRNTGIYRTSKIRIDKMDAIGMIWDGYIKNEEKWNHMYELAKVFYTTYGHLKIPHHFKTLDGINYAENGLKLGKWFYNQKQIYNGLKAYSLSQKRIDKLNRLNINWNASLREERWIEKYLLAKKYYERYGDLNIPYNFETKDGIKLGVWINNQRILYRKGSISKERIDLLNNIDMIWNIKKSKYLSQEITIKNSREIKSELLKLLKELLSDMKGNFNSIDDVKYINEIFTEEIEKVKKGKN